MTDEQKTFADLMVWRGIAVPKLPRTSQFHFFDVNEDQFRVPGDDTRNLISVYETAMSWSGGPRRDVLELVTDREAVFPVLWKPWTWIRPKIVWWRRIGHILALGGNARGTITFEEYAKFLLAKQKK